MGLLSPLAGSPAGSPPCPQDGSVPVRPCSILRRTVPSTVGILTSQPHSWHPHKLLSSCQGWRCCRGPAVCSGWEHVPNPSGRTHPRGAELCLCEHWRSGAPSAAKQRSQLSAGKVAIPACYFMEFDKGLKLGMSRLAPALRIGQLILAPTSSK